MILPILIYLISIALGFSALRLIPVRWYKAELAAASVAMGLLLGSWLMFLSAWVFGYTIAPWLTIVILGAACWGSFKYQPTPLATTQTFSKPGDKKYWLSVTVLSFLVLGYLFYTHMMLFKNGAYYSGGSTWGDLALHRSLITRFAYETH